MTQEHARLRLLLDRLRQLELQPPPEHERAIVEVARQALREAIGELAHRLFDLGYVRDEPGHRVA